MRLLRMTGLQHDRLAELLLLADGHEAVALALCGRQSAMGRELFTVHQIIPVAPEACIRRIDAVTWPTRELYAAMPRCLAAGLTVLKLHSHPDGMRFFSVTDDASDAELLSAVARRLGGVHLSAVMTSDGQMIARAVDAAGSFHPIDRIAVVGDEITVTDNEPAGALRDFDVRHRQMFGDQTTELLGRLTIGVAGVSGTGSPTIEMLARLGVGRLILVDDDVVEGKNLNRIYGATRDDANAAHPKAQVLADHVRRLGLGVQVEPLVMRVDAEEARAALGVCDVVFGCMDSVEGRDALNRLASACLTPYFDIGVRLDADGAGGIQSVSAAVHYLQPGGSSLKSRGVYSDAELYAEHLSRTEPEFYADQVRRGYIRGVSVDRPAVVSINTAIAATAVNELLARLHPFRSRSNREFATQRLLISHGRMMQSAEGDPDLELAAAVGLAGGRKPRLEDAA
jgi:hypothetical protein